MTVWGAARPLVMSVCLSLSAGAVAGPRDLAGELSAAQAALAAGDYAKAFEAYRAHTDDNPLAQFSLALFYVNGWGRPEDPVEACRWQEKAAKGGIPAAENALGDCLRRGVHRKADPAAAAKWYRKAIDAGIATAACSLAELYMAGDGVPKDPNRAVELCQTAARKGLPVAQVRLARFLTDGDPSIRDKAKALEWLRAAAQADFPEAQYRLGLMLGDGAGPSSDPVAARWWLESAAGKGWLSAYLPTAERYFHTPVDPETGLLSAEDLAKSYLWAAAAVRRLPAGDEAKKARDLLAQITAVMPATWRPDLDRRIEEHLSLVTVAHGGGAKR